MRNEVSRARRLLDQGYLLDDNGKLVHRKVCRQAHGWFPNNWVVHHVDEDKSNNVPENLIALPRELHDSLYKAMRKNKCLFNRKQIEQALKSWRGIRSSKAPKITIVVQSVSKESIASPQKL